MRIDGLTNKVSRRGMPFVCVQLLTLILPPPMALASDHDSQPALLGTSSPEDFNFTTNANGDVTLNTDNGSVLESKADDGEGASSSHEANSFVGTSVGPETAARIKVVRSHPNPEFTKDLQPGDALYEGMVNHAHLYIDLCDASKKVCISALAQAYGQSCEQSLADSYGYSHSFVLEHSPDHSNPMRYISWHCVLEMPSDEDMLADGISGKPGKTAKVDASVTPQ